MSKDILLKAAEDAESKGKAYVDCVLEERKETIEGESVVVEDAKDVQYTPEAIRVMASHANKNITIQGRILNLKKGKGKGEVTTTNDDGGDGPGGGPKA